MIMIEPCCFQKQLIYFFKSFFGKDKPNFGYIGTNGDFVMAEFLRWMTVYLPMSEVTIVCKEVSDAVIREIHTLLNWNYYDHESKTNRRFLERVNIITNGKDKERVKVLIEKNPGKVHYSIDKHSMNYITFRSKDDFYVFSGEFPIEKMDIAVKHTIQVQNNMMAYREIHETLDSVMRTKELFLVDGELKRRRKVKVKKLSS